MTKVMNGYSGRDPASTVVERHPSRPNESLEQVMENRRTDPSVQDIHRRLRLNGWHYGGAGLRLIRAGNTRARLPTTVTAVAPPRPPHCDGGATVVGSWSCSAGRSRNWMTARHTTNTAAISTTATPLGWLRNTKTSTASTTTATRSGIR